MPLLLLPPQIFAGSFGGPTLYENPQYTSPNAVRAAIKRAAQGRYKNKVSQRDKRQDHVAANPLQRDRLQEIWKAGSSDEDEGDE